MLSIEGEDYRTGTRVVIFENRHKIEEKWKDKRGNVSHYEYRRK
jgi:hypothetical protein